MSIYTGVTNIAKKAKGYVGVGGVAKKLKSGYIGDANGIARKFFSSYQFPVKSGRYTSVDTQTVQIFTAQECIDAIAHGATKLKYKITYKAVNFGSAYPQDYGYGYLGGIAEATYKLPSGVTNKLFEIQSTYSGYLYIDVETTLFATTEGEVNLSYLSQLQSVGLYLARRGALDRSPVVRFIYDVDYITFDT